MGGERGGRVGLAALALTSVATNPAFQWPVVAEYMLDRQILLGLARTLELTLIAMAVGLVLGTLLGDDAAVAQSTAPGSAVGPISGSSAACRRWCS